MILTNFKQLMNKKLISIIIPTKDEQDSLNLLYQEILQVTQRNSYQVEIIFVDDGSGDNTLSILKKLHEKDKRVRLISLRGNFGKSIALQSGFEISKGDIIFTLDADLQDNPSEIPSFLEKISQGYDLVSGWKKKRRDPSLSKVVPSRVMNYLTRIVTGVPIHDTNCGFKAYKREVIDNLNLYGELYRFIPVIAAKQNFKVGEVIVEHRSRKFGKTKFGWSRGVKGILDLLTIVFITTYLKRPGHFFGVLGLIFFTGGFIIGLYIVYLRVTTGGIEYRQPLLVLGILLMIIGVQMISTGLLAEMMTYYNQRRESKNFIREIL